MPKAPVNGLTHCALHALSLLSFVVLTRRKSPLSKDDTTPLKRKIWTRILNSFVRCSNAPLTSGVPYTVKTVWTSCNLPNLNYAVRTRFLGKLLGPIPISLVLIFSQICLNVGPLVVFITLTARSLTLPITFMHALHLSILKP